MSFSGRYAMLGFAFLVVRCCSFGQTISYEHNATSCEQCHSTPFQFGSSPLTVQRVGISAGGRFVPTPQGGIRHRHGETQQGNQDQIAGERVSANLLGDGYIEAIDDRDIKQIASQRRTAKLGISGVAASAPVLESGETERNMRTGRFGWKSQHGSLLSACADSLRNELGIRNRLYPDEYSTHKANDTPTPFDTPDPKTGLTELDRLVREIRQTAPLARDEQLAAGLDAQVGEKLFNQIGCELCHVGTFKTLPPGTKINGGTYTVPDYIGGRTIHPYTDFLLHDVGTGDGIPQAARPEYLDQSTANQFRTAPLWGVRFRSWMMHDGKSITYHQAIMRHDGEAAKIRERYERLSPVQKEQLRAFLDSL